MIIFFSTYNYKIIIPRAGNKRIITGFTYLAASIVLNILSAISINALAAVLSG